MSLAGYGLGIANTANQVAQGLQEATETKRRHQREDIELRSGQIIQAPDGKWYHVYIDLASKQMKADTVPIPSVDAQSMLRGMDQIIAQSPQELRPGLNAIKMAAASNGRYDEGLLEMSKITTSYAEKKSIDDANNEVRSAIAELQVTSREQAEEFQRQMEGMKQENRMALEAERSSDRLQAIRTTQSRIDQRMRLYGRLPQAVSSRAQMLKQEITGLQNKVNGIDAQYANPVTSVMLTDDVKKRMEEQKSVFYGEIEEKQSELETLLDNASGAASATPSAAKGAGGQVRAKMSLAGFFQSYQVPPDIRARIAEMTDGMQFILKGQKWEKQGDSVVAVR
jgi:hypothetical protein